MKSLFCYLWEERLRTKRMNTYINRLYCNWICPQIVTIFYPYEVMRLVCKHDNPIANNAYRTLSHSVLKIEHFTTIEVL